MEPALTPEEWRSSIRALSVDGGRLGWANAGRGGAWNTGLVDPFRFSDGHGEYSDGLSVIPEKRHALAALALHGQPFGFTRDHLSLLTKLVLEARNLTRDEFVAADNLHAIIKALLPPEEK